MLSVRELSGVETQTKKKTKKKYLYILYIVHCRSSNSSSSGGIYLIVSQINISGPWKN